MLLGAAPGMGDPGRAVMLARLIPALPLARTAPCDHSLRSQRRASHNEFRDALERAMQENARLLAELAER